jgi:putative oxidoreductase
MIAMWSKFAPVLQSVLRIVAAYLFILHGTTKLFAWPASILPGGGTVPLTNIAGIGGLIEVILGPLVLLGLFTQPAAFILAGEMAVAYFKAHAPRGFFPILNGGEAPVFFCFLWLYVSAAGAGPLSLDALIRKKS